MGLGAASAAPRTLIYWESIDLPAPAGKPTLPN